MKISHCQSGPVDLHGLLLRFSTHFIDCSSLPISRSINAFHIHYKWLTASHKYISTPVKHNRIYTILLFYRMPQYDKNSKKPVSQKSSRKYR